MKLRPQDMKKKDLHELFVSTMLPRPIAFVSTVSEEGIFNLAPLQFFYSALLEATNNWV